MNPYGTSSSMGDKLHRATDLLGVRTPDMLYQQLVSHWKEPASLVLDSGEPPTVLTSSNDPGKLADFTERMMFMDTVSYLPDDILVKVDRASMAVSLESRVPFLDHRVVEFAWRVPLSMKIRDRKGKWLVRQVLYKYVPKELVERPKMGFGVPIDSWLRGPLREWAESLLDETKLRTDGFFNPQPIRQKWNEHLQGRHNWQYYLWDVLMFQAWLAT
jgi:asparagine synthase (glutamine-hydrolysing)